MTEPDVLTIFRGSNVLKVIPKPTGFDLITSGGPNVSETEYDQIESYVQGRPGATAFLAKVRARMER